MAGAIVLVVGSFTSMMRGWRPCLVLLLGGCVAPCSCDCDGNISTSTSTGTVKDGTQRPSALGRDGGPVPGDPGAATPAGGGFAGRSALAPENDVLAAWASSDEEVTRKLSKVQQRLRKKLDAKPGESPKKVEGDALGAVLAHSLGDFVAAEDFRAGEIRFAEKGLPVVSREYADGDRNLYVKVTDTGAAPRAHETVIELLTDQGRRAGTFVRGGFVRGYPGVFSYSPRHASTKGALVVAERFLIELRIRNSTDPDDARRVFEALDWSDLAPDEGPDG